MNPVKAKLVERAEDWEFSSFIDYCGIRNGKLINKERAAEYVDIIDIEGVTLSDTLNKYRTNNIT